MGIIQNINIENIDYKNLADINDISVDKNLSKNERISEYIKQIKNPYCYKCGKFVVIAKFKDEGISLEERLTSILLWFLINCNSTFPGNCDNM